MNLDLLGVDFLGCLKFRLWLIFGDDCFSFIIVCVPLTHGHH